MRLSFPDAILLAFAATLGLVARPTAAQQPWRVTAQPTLRIGVLEGAPNYQFDRLGGVYRLSDGRIVLVNNWEIRYYDASGRHLRTTGGRGDGPGEFRNLRQIMPSRGDTVVAWDPLSFRVSRFDPEGNFVSAETYDRPEPIPGYGSEGQSLLPDGSVFIPMFRSTRPGDPTPQGLYRPEVRMARFDPRGGELTFLGTTVYGGLRQEFFELGSRRFPFGQPFAPNYRQVASPDRIFATDNERFLIDVYAYDGTLVAQLTSPSRQPHPVTPAQLDAYRASTIERYREGGDTERVREFDFAWSRIEKPATHPVFGIMAVDSEGLLWVQVVNPSRADSEYAILDASGRELGSLALPAGFFPTQIGRDYVLGRERGAFDVLYVVMYGLTRPPGLEP